MRGRGETNGHNGSWLQACDLRRWQICYKEHGTTFPSKEIFFFLKHYALALIFVLCMLNKKGLSVQVKNKPRVRIQIMYLFLVQGSTWWQTVLINDYARKKFRDPRSKGENVVFIKSYLLYTTYNADSCWRALVTSLSRATSQALPGTGLTFCEGDILPPLLRWSLNTYSSLCIVAECSGSSYPPCLSLLPKYSAWLSSTLNSHICFYSQFFFFCWTKLLNKVSLLHCRKS